MLVVLLFFFLLLLFVGLETAESLPKKRKDRPVRLSSFFFSFCRRTIHRRLDPNRRYHGHDLMEDQSDDDSTDITIVYISIDKHSYEISSEIDKRKTKRSFFFSSVDIHGRDVIHRTRKKNTENRRRRRAHCTDPKCRPHYSTTHFRSRTILYRDTSDRLEFLFPVITKMRWSLF